MIRNDVGVTIMICSLLFACTAVHPQKSGEETDGVLITPRHLNKVGGVEWHLITMTLDTDPIPLVENSKPTFSCTSEGQVAGMATINRYFGKIKN